MSAVVQISGLHKHYGSFHALKGIDLSIAHGEVVVVVGPSGSGKSTLIRCINLLEDYQRGEVRVDGEKVVRGKALAKVRAEVLNGHKPASTLVYVSGLVKPEWKVEIDVIAAR